ncbi:MAG: DUF4345 domain-containing protein [Steroidobacteraceae bacterium]
MTKAFLIITGVLWLGYGIYLLIAPQELAGIAGVTATSTTGTVELRAMYGGLQAAVGVLALWAGVSAAWRTQGLTALLFLYGGMGLARLASAAVTQEFSTYVIGALCFELPSAWIAWALLRREVRPDLLRGMNR